MADLTYFPVYVGISENGVAETREDFLALGADTVITPELQEAVEGTDVTALSASMAGFTMMTEGVSGSITFSMTADGLAITGINYRCFPKWMQDAGQASRQAPHRMHSGETEISSGFRSRGQARWQDMQEMHFSFSQRICTRLKRLNHP